MKIRTVSKRQGGTKPKADEVVFDISRGSPLGNPFYMRSENERESVIFHYRNWLVQNYQTNPTVRQELDRIRAALSCGHKVALSCWCAPKACHGDVVIECLTSTV